MEYKINLYGIGSCYSQELDTIFLGDLLNANKKLSENKFSEYIADVITHEFIHSLLYKKFNSTVSALFDIIGHYFRDIKLLEKVCNETYIGTPWHIYIKEKGVHAFFEDYSITDNDLFIANAICRGI